MDIRLQIDHLVLDGIDLSAGESAHLQDHLIRELTGLLEQRGLSGEKGVASDPRVPTTIRIPVRANARTLAPQIAHAIHSNLASASGMAGGVTSSGIEAPHEKTLDASRANAASG